jgi:hypothetical protein
MKTCLKSILIIVFLLIISCTPTLKQPQHEVPSEKAEPSLVEESLGIKVDAIRWSAKGYMLDFRYKAIDPEKAAVLFSRKTQPYLLHEATGAIFSVPTTAKVGPLRQTTNKPIAGKSYFMIFGNPGKYVKPGDNVTIIFGNYRIEHLTVE